MIVGMIDSKFMRTREQKKLRVANTNQSEMKVKAYESNKPEGFKFCLFLDVFW